MGKVYVVGIGPGGAELITPQARAAMDRADVLCGYTVYLDLVRPLFPDKETYVTPMRQELDRCRWALETASRGKTVALVCSGDAGVYGMASPLLELALEFPEVEVEIVPGVTAALSGAALLGAPLGHDFCVISLSDLLTPWEVIEKRLTCAAEGDFAICLYEEALQTVNCRVERFFLREKDCFVLTKDLLPCIKPGLDMLFLCSPNNPPGRSVPTELLEKIRERCRRCEALLVLDACFGDFLPGPPQDGPFVLRSFTKWYPMAGLRLGYAVCPDTELLEEMRCQGPPWPVSAPAQAAGLAALEEQAYSQELAALIREQRPVLAAGLAELGCRVIPGEANFLLFSCPDTGLDGKLEERGILLRNCSNFPGLGPGWYRASVRMGEENQALLRAMREVL